MGLRVKQSEARRVGQECFLYRKGGLTRAVNKIIQATC